jgi:hypothetical protein|tara:strand:- start:13178 stop:13396 length:219 start_codon:yes stop_codon:yes gene_type:complete
MKIITTKLFLKISSHYGTQPNFGSPSQHETGGSDFLKPRTDSLSDADIGALFEKKKKRKKRRKTKMVDPIPR